MLSDKSSFMLLLLLYNVQGLSFAEVFSGHRCVGLLRLIRTTVACR
jgi:hypothetical protein